MRRKDVWENWGEGAAEEVGQREESDRSASDNMEDIGEVTETAPEADRSASDNIEDIGEETETADTNSQDNSMTEEEVLQMYFEDETQETVQQQCKQM